VSAETGEGMEDLFAAIERAVEDFYKDYPTRIQEPKKDPSEADEMKDKSRIWTGFSKTCHLTMRMKELLK